MDEIEGRLASLMRSITAADTSLGVRFEVGTNTRIHGVLGLGRGNTRFTLHLLRRAGSFLNKDKSETSVVHFEAPECSHP